MIQTIERVPSGIEGFDQLVEGGIPSSDLILLSGTSGAGKTIFGLHFLFSSNDPGIYVSFEEEIEQLKKIASVFGWSTDTNKNVRFLKYDPFKISDIFEIIESNIRETKAKRVVIDSISALGIYVKDPSELRRMILQISTMLRKNKVTSLLTSETFANKKSLSRFGVEEFVTDGVIVLHNFFVSDEYRRGISIWKMRSTNHSRKIHPYKISDKGFTVFPNDTVSRTTQ